MLAIARTGGHVLLSGPGSITARAHTTRCMPMRVCCALHIRRANGKRGKSASISSGNIPRWTATLVITRRKAYAAGAKTLTCISFHAWRRCSTVHALSIFPSCLNSGARKGRTAFTSRGCFDQNNVRLDLGRRPSRLRGCILKEQ